jgi:hypothetical protein
LKFAEKQRREDKDERENLKFEGNPDGKPGPENQGRQCQRHDGDQQRAVQPLSAENQHDEFQRHDGLQDGEQPVIDAGRFVGDGIHRGPFGMNRFISAQLLYPAGRDAQRSGSAGPRRPRVRIS